MNRVSLLSAGILASLATSVMALDTAPAAKALQAYKQQFAKKDAGVHKGATYTFFVADQPCLGKQKYAGSKESRLAERQAMVLMAQYTLGRMQKPPRSAVGVPGALGDDIYDLHWQQQQARIRVNNGHRIVDEDTGNCSRRVVYALRSDELAALLPTPSTEIDTSTLQQKVLAGAMATKNYLRLAEYFASLRLDELAIAFAAQSPEASSSDALFRYPVSVKWNTQQQQLMQAFEQCRSEAPRQKTAPLNQLVAFNRSAFCRQPLQINLEGLQFLTGVDASLGKFAKPLADGDLQDIVEVTLQQHGFVLFDQTFRAPDMKPFNDEARQLFDKGRQPEDIVRLFSYSLNINPLQPVIWSQLGAVMSAFALHGPSYAFAMQALLQAPSNADYWLQVANALTALKRVEQAKSMVQLATELADQLTWSDWGRNQATKLNHSLKAQ